MNETLQEITQIAKQMRETKAALTAEIQERTAQLHGMNLALDILERHADFLRKKYSMNAPQIGLHHE